MVKNTSDVNYEFASQMKDDLKLKLETAKFRLQLKNFANQYKKEFRHLSHLVEEVDYCIITKSNTAHHVYVELIELSNITVKPLMKAWIIGDATNVSDVNIMIDQCVKNHPRPIELKFWARDLKKTYRHLNEKASNIIQAAKCNDLPVDNILHNISMSWER